MKLKYLVLVFVCLFLFSCNSVRYAGKKQPELVKYACTLQEVICKRQGKNLKVQYQVEKISANTYIIEGFAVFNSTQEYNPYDTVDSLKLEFVFLNKNLAVHEENILVYGVIGKKLVFKKEFTSVKTINSSVIADAMTFLSIFG